MNMPGFNAELSLELTAGTYGWNINIGRSTKNEVFMQQFGTPSFPGSLFTMRCCGYSTILNRFVCTTKNVSPLEQCECQRNSFGPVIICRPPVLSRG